MTKEERNAYMKAYYTRPENRLKRVAYMREYNQRQEVIDRRRKKPFDPRIRPHKVYAYRRIMQKHGLVRNEG